MGVGGGGPCLAGWVQAESRSGNSYMSDPTSMSRLESGGEAECLRKLLKSVKFHSYRVFPFGETTHSDLKGAIYSKYLLGYDEVTPITS